MTIRRNLLAVLAAFILLLAHMTPTLAGGVVTNCTETDLKNAVAGGGLITFNCGVATITLTSPLDITAPDTTIDGGGQITLSGGTTSQIIRHRSLSSPSTLTLQNLTLSDGNASGIDTASNGGAVWSVFQGNNAANKPSLNVINVNFLNNVSDDQNSSPTRAYDFGGGAIFSQGGYVNISNSTFNGNRADGAGGAIHILRSNLSIIGSSFLNNLAIGVVEQSSGGAIYIDGMQIVGVATTNILRSSFSNNISYNEGGAIYIHMYQGVDTFTVDRTSFSSNTIADGSRAQGGAISGGNGKVTITNSMFNGNTVTKSNGDGSGGAISITQPAVITIANSTLVYNSANGTSFNANGGAIYIVNNSTQFKIINSTIANNHAGWAGGGISSSTNGILQNTIIANNTADNGPNPWDILQQCSARLVNGGGNIQFPDRNPNPNYFNEIICATGITIADPQLSPIGSNYSTVWTAAIPRTSPAIDKGNPAVCAAAPINNRDQRGQPRLIDGDNNGTALCDSGAYEYSNVPFTHYTATVPTLTWNQVTWAQNYEVQVDIDPAFNYPMFKTVVSASTLSVTPTGLPAPNLFYWRVRAQKPDGTWGNWSAVDTFVFDS